MKKVASSKKYDYYVGIDGEEIFYNIVPAGSPAPKTGYLNKEFILRIKKAVNLFPEINK